MRQNDNPLRVYFDNNPDQEIIKWPRYFEIYHRHFQRFVGTPMRILEIGVNQGGSLQMWKHYFGLRCQVFGIDIQPKCKQVEEDRISVFIGDQSDREFLTKVAEEAGPFDIIVDDGSHQSPHQITSFEVLYPHVSDNGIYWCEDTYNSYNASKGGGYKREDTFIEYTKNFIDQLYGFHIEIAKRRNARSKKARRLAKNSKMDFSNIETETLTNITRSMDSIHFYDGVVVAEKLERTGLEKSMRRGKRAISLEHN